MHTVETITDPVEFEKKTFYGSIMVQTDPIVFEDKEMLCEPEGLVPAAEPDETVLSQSGSVNELLKEPVNEAPFVLELPQPQEPEEDKQEGKDWAESALFEFVKQQHFNKMVKKGIVSEEDAKTDRPTTPDSQRGLSLKEKQVYNLK